MLAQFKNVAVALLIAAAFAAAGSIFWQHAVVAVYKGFIYEGVRKIGDDCSIAFGSWSEDSRFSDIADRPHIFKDLSMPLRRHGSRPLTRPGEYSLTVCRIDVSGIDSEVFAWVNLGPVFGRSAVFLNERLLLTQDDNSWVGFPLPPADRVSAAKIAIISINSGTKEDSVGLASLIDPFVTQDRSALGKFDWWRSYFAGEGPSTRTALAVGLLLIFACVWILGIRYDDVTWMIFMSGLFVVEQALQYAQAGRPDAPMVHISHSIGFASYYAQVAFLYTFLRFDRGRRYLLPLGILATAAFWAITTYVPPRHLMLGSFGFRTGGPLVLAAVALLWVAWRGREVLAKVDGVRRQRILVLLGFITVVSCLYFIQAITLIVVGWTLAPLLKLAAICLFAGFLAADLAVFQRQFFSEKTRRIEEEKQKQQLEYRLALGRSVQDMLMPALEENGFEGYRYRFFYKPAEILAGDWMYTWDTAHGERRLLFGDVVGKGPQAAIVVASIATLLNDCRRRDLGTVECFQYVNARILELFGRYMTTTMAMVSLSPDGQITLANCGTAGFFRCGKGEPEYIPLRSSSIGVVEDLTVATASLRLAPNETLLAFTDGLVDGARAMNRLVAELRTMPVQAEFEQIYGLVEKVGEGSVINDDKTLLAIRAA